MQSMMGYCVLLIRMKKKTHFKANGKCWQRHEAAKILITAGVIYQLILNMNSMSTFNKVKSILQIHMLLKCIKFHLIFFCTHSIPQYKLFSSNPYLNFFICKGLGLENLEALVKKTVLSKGTLIISYLTKDSTANFYFNML